MKASLEADCESLGCGHLSSELWEKFEEAYTESHRHYHTLSHVTKMLDEFPDPSQAILRLAVWFHDVIYDPRRSDNEKMSADLVGQWMPGLEISLIRKIENLVMATDHRKPAPDGYDEGLIRDVDLLILSAPRNEYSQYTQQIRLRLTDDNFTGFKGSNTARRIGIINRYVLGIDATCL